MKLILFFILFYTLTYSQNQKKQPNNLKQTPPIETPKQVVPPPIKEEVKDKIREALKRRELGRFGDKRF